VSCQRRSLEKLGRLESLEGQSHYQHCPLPHLDPEDLGWSTSKCGGLSWGEKGP